MKSYILLKNIRFYAYHGVLPQETKVGNTYSISLKIGADLSSSMITDRIEDTINYAEIYNLVDQQMRIPSKLLEHVAQRIIASSRKAFPQITSIELKLSKHNPPMGAEIESASILLID